MLRIGQLLYLTRKSILYILLTKLEVAMKLNDRLKVPQERIDEIFEKLAKLPKPKAPILKDVFESKLKQIEMYNLKRIIIKNKNPIDTTHLLLL